MTTQRRIEQLLLAAALLVGLAATGLGCDETEVTSDPGGDPTCTPAPGKPVGGPRVPRPELMALDPGERAPRECPPDPVAGHLPRPQAPDAGPADRPDAAS